MYHIKHLLIVTAFILIVVVIIIITIHFYQLRAGSMDINRYHTANQIY